jgi:purine-cytosine permease-like protein
MLQLNVSVVGQTGRQIMKKLTVRPSRTASAFASVVAIAMVVFGASTLDKFGAFGVVWMLVATGIGLFHLANAVGLRGATEVIEVSDEGSPVEPKERLRQLEDLRERGLISASEYAEKRKAILDDL